jgi:hypothetical protein
LAKTILTTSRGNSGSTGILPAGTTNYYRVGNAALAENITQNRCEITWHTPGVLSRLYVKVLANSTTANSTVNLRVNGVNATSTVTIGAGVTGVVEDTGHSDTIADGDEVVYRCVTGAGGSITYALISMVFAPTTAADCVSKQVNHGYSPAAASATQFANVSGRLSGITSSEVNTESSVKKAGIAKNAFMFISGNARTTTTTWTLRKNRADTALVMTVAAGATGIFENTTTSVPYSADDEMDWKLTTGAGTEILTFFSLSIDYITTDGYGFVNASSVGASGDITLAPGVTEYYVVGGAMIEATTIEAEAAITAREAFTLSGLTVNARANTITAPSTVTLMKNGSPTAITLTIDSSAAGFFSSDPVNAVEFAATDTMSYKVVTGATGTLLTISQMALWTLPTTVPLIVSGGGSQGRPPLYREVRSREVSIAIVRVRIPLEYEVEKLSIQVPLHYTIQIQRPIVRFASAVLTPIARILPLPIRPTPEPPQIKIVRLSIPLSYEVTNLQLKAACSYEVERLFTQKEQQKIVAASINFLSAF